MMPSARSTTAAILRRCLLGLFALGATGTGADLLLIGHTDGVNQWAPLVLLGCGIASAAWCAVDRQPMALRVFQTTMIALLLGGAAGLWLHYRGNVEFAREGTPELSGLDLFFTAIQGASPPTLAPGTLIHLGLIGLAYTYRHPAVAMRPEDAQGSSQ